jgi:hypothetical protein
VAETPRDFPLALGGERGDVGAERAVHELRALVEKPKALRELERPVLDLELR